MKRLLLKVYLDANLIHWANRLHAEIEIKEKLIPSCQLQTLNEWVEGRVSLTELEPRKTEKIQCGRAKQRLHLRNIPFEILVRHSREDN